MDLGRSTVLYVQMVSRNWANIVTVQCALPTALSALMSITVPFVIRLKYTTMGFVLNPAQLIMPILAQQLMVKKSDTAMLMLVQPKKSNH